MERAFVLAEGREEGRKEHGVAHCSNEFWRGSLFQWSFVGWLLEDVRLFAKIISGSITWKLRVREVRFKRRRALSLKQEEVSSIFFFRKMQIFDLLKNIKSNFLFRNEVLNENILFFFSTYFSPLYHYRMANIYIFNFLGKIKSLLRPKICMYMEYLLVGNWRNQST